MHQAFLGAMIYGRCGIDIGGLCCLGVTGLDLAGKGFNLGPQGRALTPVAKSMGVVLPGSFPGLGCIGQLCIPLC